MKVEAAVPSPQHQEQPLKPRDKSGSVARRDPRDSFAEQARAHGGGIWAIEAEPEKGPRIARVRDMRVGRFVGDPRHFARLHLDPPASKFDGS